MSREYSHSVDLPRNNTPFALKEAINAAITTYASEDEAETVSWAPKPVNNTSKPKRSTLATIPSQSIVPTVPKQSTKSSRKTSGSKPAPSRSVARATEAQRKQEEEELEMAIKLSIQEQSRRDDALFALPTDDIGPSQLHTESEELRNESIAATLGLSDLPDSEFNEYTVWNASLSNMRVCPIDLTAKNPDYFYIENRSFLPNKPGVTIHLGSDKKAPTICVAHLDYFSTKNLIGLGDPKTNPLDVKWEKLHKDSFWTHMRYSFQYDFGTGEGEATRFGDHSGVRKFEWHRTKQIYWLLDQPDLVLVEAGTHDVYALYKGGNFGQMQKQRGNLKIKKGMDQGWQRLVLLGWASIVELQRRRTRERRVATLFGRII
ncbi:hypothetical protein BJ878DRAFT_511509 [Calycina marina]|uniref:Uncharacterized protein n=1 Tax=Calycina marina TaxID=1763456 RepID=A0A9P8CE47_9HELO|nr:hypothetical protein BJ878DRAFT_511509 [Calycina marina]